MKIVLSQDGITPLNEQIRLQIMRQITDGTLAKDECLPSVRYLARSLGVGVITVKAAYEKLESDGYIYTLAGKGCFVKETTSGKSAAAAEAVRNSLRPTLELCRSVGMDKDSLLQIVSAAFDEEDKNR